MTGTELAKSITWNIPHAAWERYPSSSGGSSCAKRWPTSTI